MNKYLTALSLLLTASFSYGQKVERLENEDAQVFVDRMMPDSMAPAHHIIETNRWCYPKKMIVATYGYNDTTDVNGGTNKFNRIDGHVYLPAGKNKYRDIRFGPITEDGGYPEIVSVFFANADRDTTKELIVLCKYFVKNYDFEGYFYQAFIYDNPTREALLLPYMEDLSRKFYGMEGGWRDGRINKAKYKTGKEIRAKLKQMGYQQ